jgi:hypothetical protein
LVKSIAAPLNGPITPRLQPERLVGVAFRHSLAAERTGESHFKELLWQEIANQIGSDRASPIASDVTCFARAIDKSACRPLEILPPGCPGFCRDECLVISMVAASQHGSCPALRSCAYALLHSVMLDEPIRTAEVLGHHLRCVGHILSPNAICEATHFIPCPFQRPN